MADLALWSPPPEPNRRVPPFVCGMAIRPFAQVFVSPPPEPNRRVRHAGDADVERRASGGGCGRPPPQRGGLGACIARLRRPSCAAAAPSISAGAAGAALADDPGRIVEVDDRFPIVYHGERRRTDRTFANDAGIGFRRFAVIPAPATMSLPRRRPAVGALLRAGSCVV